jgi:hypothetical protein
MAEVLQRFKVNPADNDEIQISGRAFRYNATKGVWKRLARESAAYTKVNSYSKTEIDGLFATLIGSSPTDMNTLEELAEALGGIADFAALSDKALIDNAAAIIDIQDKWISEHN